MNNTYKITNIYTHTHVYMYDKVEDTKGVIRSLKLKHTMDNRKLTREQTFTKKEKKERYPQKYKH